MDTNEGIVKSPKTLSVMLTYTCPAACNNCGTLSSPKNRENISLEDAVRYISEADKLGFHLVVFTGGEATLRWKDLLTCIRHATSKELPTRLVTNAHWAIRRDIAENKVRELCNAGLGEINFSAGDEHARWIPTERVVLATAIALENGLPVSVMVEQRVGRSITRDSFVRSPDIAMLPDKLKRNLTYLESPWMPLDPEESFEYEKGTVTKATVHGQKPCDSVLATYTVQGNGSIGACCGLGMRLIPELNVGRVGSESTGLQEVIESSESDLIKLALRYIGPHQLLAWAAERDPAIDWEGKYAHICHACRKLYKDPKVRRQLLDGIYELVPKIKESAVIDEALVKESIAAQTANVHSKGNGRETTLSPSRSATFGPEAKDEDVYKS